MDESFIIAAIGCAIGLFFLMALGSRCPNCGRLFAGKVKSRVITRKRSWRSNGKQLVTYKCRWCKYVWRKEKTIYDPPDL